MFREMLAFLTADGWHVAPDTFDGLPCIRTRFNGTDEAWDCRVRPYDPFGQLAFESILPVAAPPEHRDAVTALIVRTNWRLLTGAYQLDVETGELVFRTMLFLPDGAELSTELCRGLVYSNVLTVDRCLAQFVKATAGGDPIVAFEQLAL
jgi:hypothetical protein